MNIGSSFYVSSLQRQFSQLQDAQAKTQATIASGKTFVQASDNPGAALATQRISLQRHDLAADAERRDLAGRLNETSILTAEQVRSLLEEATVKIEQAYAYDPDDVANVGFGAEIDGYIEQAVAFLNYQSEGRYLFGGNQTAAAPFALERADPDNPRSPILGVAYVGSTEPLEFEIGLEVRMDPTANALLNASWGQWVDRLVAAKTAFAGGDVTASKQALDEAGVAKDDAFASTTDLLGKSLRIQTLQDWSVKADKNLANQEASLQEADINEVILRFNELQRNYQAGLQSGRLLLSLSLVDFL
jgi:flagellin-like hook-associated protein FlgL